MTTRRRRIEKLLEKYPTLLITKEVLDILNISYATLTRYRRLGVIKSKRLCGIKGGAAAIRYIKEDIITYLMSD